MYRRAFLKTGIGAAGLTLAAPYVARDVAPVALRWAHFAQEDHAANIAAKPFAVRVEERTGGAIKINIFPTMSWAGRPSRHSRSSSAPSTWDCRRKGSSTNTTSPSPR